MRRFLYDGMTLADYKRYVREQKTPYTDEQIEAQYAFITEFARQYVRQANQITIETKNDKEAA